MCLMAKDTVSIALMHGQRREGCGEVYIVVRPIFTDLGYRRILQTEARSGLKALQDGNITVDRSRC